MLVTWQKQNDHLLTKLLQNSLACRYSHTCDVLFSLPKRYPVHMSEDDHPCTAVNALWGLLQDTAPCISLVGHEESASRHGLSIQQHVCMWKKCVSTGKSKKQSRFFLSCFHALDRPQKDCCGFAVMCCIFACCTGNLWLSISVHRFPLSQGKT